MASLEEYALAHRRDVQCLLSPDRQARKHALERLSNPVHVEFFLQEAQSAVFRTFSDQVDRVREAAVDLVMKLYSGDDGGGFSESTIYAVQSTLPTVAPLVSSRMKSESSEEIKLKLVSLLQLILKASLQNSAISKSLLDHTGEFLEAVRSSLADACPDLKKLGAAVVTVIPSLFPMSRLTHSSTVLKSVVAALIGNAKHTHWRVRTATVASLCALLSVQDSSSVLLSEFVTEALAFAALAISDRQVQVRSETVKCLGVWLASLINVSGGVASMVDGQYVLVDLKKEERHIQGLLFQLLLGLTDEEETVRLETSEAVCRVATVFVQKTIKETEPVLSAAVAQFVQKFRSLRIASVSSSLPVALWENAHVCVLLDQFKNGLIQQALAAGPMAKRALVVLSPWSVEVLDSVVTLLVLHSTEQGDFASLLNETAVYMQYVVPILAKNLGQYLNQQQFPMANALLTVLLRLLQVCAAEDAVRALSVLEDCVDETRVPRGVLSRNVGMCAEVIRGQTPVAADVLKRVHSVLLRAETVTTMDDDIFDEAFLCSEAGRVSLPVLSVLLARTSTLTFRPHLMEQVFPRLLHNVLDEEKKTEVLEVLDVVFKKLVQAQAQGPAAAQQTQFVGACIEKVLVPYIEWRPGQANAKIRRGALVILLSGVELVPSVGAEHTLLDYWGVFKSAMDDNWVPDNRYATVILVRNLMLKIDPHISTLVQRAQEGTAEIFRDMYPELLKRLDDSQDAIRVEAATTISALFEVISDLSSAKQQPPSLLLSNSSVTYMVKALLVHLEDSNEAVWKAVEGSVQKAALLNRPGVVDELRTGEIKSSKPQRCANILAALVAQN